MNRLIDIRYGAYLGYIVSTLLRWNLTLYGEIPRAYLLVHPPHCSQASGPPRAAVPLATKISRSQALSHARL